MNDFPSRRTIEDLKARYTKGMRVRLLKMDDPHAPDVGTLGTVMGVDDIGSLLVRWDNGSRLNVVYGEDFVEFVARNQESEELLTKLEALRGCKVKNHVVALEALIHPYVRVHDFEHQGQFVFGGKLEDGQDLRIYTLPIDEAENWIKIEFIRLS